MSLPMTLPTTMPLPTARTGRIERPDGATIVYEITGSGPALLFAHGLGGNHFSWWQQLPVFARTHTCIAFSHRGFAPSTIPSGAPDPHDYAGDAAALLDHLEIDRVVHVGQSMGGWTGVELALNHPDRLAGLVLACTTGSLSFDGFDDPAIAEWRERAPRMRRGDERARRPPGDGQGLRRQRARPAQSLRHDRQAERRARQGGGSAADLGDAQAAAPRMPRASPARSCASPARTT
jgi:pimeloyl-ACP methyl ester carboxylesterase